MKSIKRLIAKVKGWRTTCIRCGYTGNFPDSGECPACGEQN